MQANGGGTTSDVAVGVGDGDAGARVGVGAAVAGGVPVADGATDGDATGDGVADVGVAVAAGLQAAIASTRIAAAGSHRWRPAGSIVVASRLGSSDPPLETLRIVRPGDTPTMTSFAPSGKGETARRFLLRPVPCL